MMSVSNAEADYPGMQGERDRVHGTATVWRDPVDQAHKRADLPRMP